MPQVGYQPPTAECPYPCLPPPVSVQYCPPPPSPPSGGSDYYNPPAAPSGGSDYYNPPAAPSEYYYPPPPSSSGYYYPPPSGSVYYPPPPGSGSVYYPPTPPYMSYNSPPPPDPILPYFPYYFKSPPPPPNSSSPPILKGYNYLQGLPSINIGQAPEDLCNRIPFDRGFRDHDHGQVLELVFERPPEAMNATRSSYSEENYVRQEENSKPSHGQDGSHHLQVENSKSKLSLQGKKSPKETSSGMKCYKEGDMFTMLTGKGQTIDDDDNRDQVLTTSTARTCADCKTSKTPLWRSGPHGPKSLCNACGIRYRKRRRREIEFLKMGKGIAMKEKQRQVVDEEGVLLLLQGKFAGKEEAEAALLLMALSCGLCVH
ncbi:hypothetical protein NE237_007532 [Protea cynaroides]|uniref:GATA-type domain-containing protein n=1 Tax=Protea cynaroides TaxID=273540 RepID=A0A9Q0KPB4_9MAGN|nr:hypothetical protein NE237_007532 [Protea cynaroides]